MGARLRAAVVAACFIAMMLSAPSAHASFPGANGKIAFVRGGDIWTMNPDGTDQVNLTNDAPVQVNPAWSPDGNRIAFHQLIDPRGGDGRAWWMMADGTNRTLADPGTPFAHRSFPTWSPTGSRLAFVAASSLWTMNPDGTQISGTWAPGNGESDWSPGGDLASVEYMTGGGCYLNHLVVAHVDGSGWQDVTPDSSYDHCNEVDVHGSSWSPDAQRIAYLSFDYCPNPCSGMGFFTIKPDGTDRQQLPNGGPHPAWSPDGTKIAFEGLSADYGRIQIMNADASGVTDITDGNDPSWQPIPINSYPRPRGATPFRVPLVPANKQCTAPNTTHGAPLSYGSCGPPQPTSGQLTTGTPDSNGLPVRMDASLLLSTATGDVKINAHVNDVFKKDLSDYSGSLRASLPLRITDKDNTPSPGAPGAGTTEPFVYGFDIPCTPDPAPTIGSDCSISTTADTLVPGTVKANLRTIWQIGRVRVDDAGPDGNPDTTADNTVFAVQGIFVP